MDLWGVGEIESDKKPSNQASEASMTVEAL